MYCEWAVLHKYDNVYGGGLPFKFTVLRYKSVANDICLMLAYR